LTERRKASPNCDWAPTKT